MLVRKGETVNEERKWPPPIKSITSSKKTYIYLNNFAHFSMLSGKHSHHVIRLLITLNCSDFLTMLPTQNWGRDSEKRFVRTQGIFVSQITAPLRLWWSYFLPITECWENLKTHSPSQQEASRWLLPRGLTNKSTQDTVSIISYISVSFL